MKTTDQFPVPKPTPTEQYLFSKHSPREKPMHEVAYTTLLRRQQAEEEPTEPLPVNIHQPEQWSTWSNNWLAPSGPGEWFAHVLRDCRRVLDIGAGSGRPSLYLAGRIPEVVALEPGTYGIRHAETVKRKLRLDNVTIVQESALSLPFDANSFDGVLFCYSLESTGDIDRSLAEANRVLKPGGAMAVALAPIEDYEHAEAGLTADDRAEPVLIYRVMTSQPLTERRYWILVRPESDLGRTIRQDAQSSSDSAIVGNDKLLELLKREASAIASVDYDCVNGITPAELRGRLLDLGFEEIMFWQMPHSMGFAKVLHDDGVLTDLQQQHFVHYLRALACSSCATRPISDYVSARKRG